MSKKTKSNKHKSKHNEYQEPIEELDPESELEDAFEEIPDADDNSNDSLKDLMEKYGDVDTEDEPPEKLEPIPHKKDQRPEKSKGKKKKRQDRKEELEPDYGKEKKRAPEKEPGKPPKRERPKEKREGKKKLKEDVKEKSKHVKPKGKGEKKGKVKGKPKEKPKKAKKLMLPEKARKLPIEEADSDVEIDWSFETPAIEDQEIANFERSRMNEQLKYIEREKINLSNELVFMKTDLDQKTQLVDELKKDYERLRNDFDSYKQRVRGEIKEKMKFASEPLLLEILDVLDNFDRTNKLDLETVDKEDLIKGIRMIYNQLIDVLKKDGLSVIEAEGKPFDPYVYDAVSTTHTDDHPHNTVLEELQKGYKYKKKVIRATKVRVSQSDIVPEIPIKREKEKPKKPEKEKVKGKEPKEPLKATKFKKLDKKKKERESAEAVMSKKKEPAKLVKKQKKLEKPEITGKEKSKKPVKHKEGLPEPEPKKLKHRPDSEVKKKMVEKRFKKKYTSEELKRLKARKKKKRALE